MDLNQIRSFITVAQTLNFTAAARQNGVPQSTISRQISDLEKQLNVQLFFRTRRDVQLTEEGHVFLPYAQEIMNAAKHGANAVRQLHTGAAGRLSIATVNTSTAFLAQCLRQFGQKYPDIIVNVDYVSSGEALQIEHEDPYDFHFIHRDMLGDGEDFDYLVTHQDTLSLVVPKGHPLVGQRPDGAALQNEKFILVTEQESPILHMKIQDIFRSYHFTPNVVNRFDNVKAVLLSVSAGLGITILPSALPCEMLSNSLELVPLADMNAEIVYAMAWKQSLLNPAARLFLEDVKAVIEQINAKSDTEDEASVIDFTPPQLLSDLSKRMKGFIRDVTNI